MKKVFATLIVFFLLGVNLSYSDSSFIYDSNLELNINSAKLIEKHVSQLKRQLELFKVKYDIVEDEKLDRTLLNLEKMGIGLKKIQEYKVSEKLSTDIIKGIVLELKYINTNLGPYLKKEITIKQNDIKKYTEIYNKPILVFSNKVKTIIQALAIKIKSKNNISTKDKLIIQNLKNMESYAKNLDRFSGIQFNTKNELKSYMVENIQNIKIEIQSIKNTLSKKS